MLNPVQTQRMLIKLKRLQRSYTPYMFTPVTALDFTLFETTDELFGVPENVDFKPISKGSEWGSARSFGWFKTEFTPDKELLGKKLYLYPHFGGAEGMLYLNGTPRGIFTLQNGNHYVSCITTCCDGAPIQLAVEMYTGHSIPGCAPLVTDPPMPSHYTYGGAEICLRNETVAGFLFDLDVLCQLVENLPETDFRRAEVINCLTEVYRAVVQSPEDSTEEEWTASLTKARECMAPCLAAKNGPSAPTAGMIGHSHMDTAWLWPTKVTLKKCARTYSNQLNLMDQYPEHTFFQSSAFHLEWIRRYYPKLFEQLAEKIAEGRYEPNGGVWVECDCNVPSGESMVRQFLWGQRYTQRFFNYRSNCFWLPDTFGYNAAIPQIMKGCGIDYFVTTKISWNDTTRFPWETFYWEGLDGTRVFTHFTDIETTPAPQDLLRRLNSTVGATAMPEKRITNHRLLPYGHGDGGGGPRFEMLETARRCEDLEGCPKVKHVKVSEFLQEMEREACSPPVHRGELYLELHRGTLTNLHEIKRNNRKAEVALHNLELAEVLTAKKEKRPADEEKITPLTEIMLINQFHDILPGTCLQEVHELTEKQMTEMIQTANKQTAELLFSDETDSLTLLNTLGFARIDTVYLHSEKAPADPALTLQKTENVEGEPMWAVSGIKLPALGSVSVKLSDSAESTKGSAFKFDGKLLETPFAKITFNDNGGIESFFDIGLQRELRDIGKLPLNTFLMGEDVPVNYDNWDVDADIELKLAPIGKLVSQRVVSDGQAELRIRSEYTLTEKTSLRQDMVFHANSPRIDFETTVDWHDRHRFLKTAFDLDLRSDYARNEIQFGCCLRPTTRNTEQQQAMFEVCNHRYTDISEPNQGAAVLNDCKYGVTVEGGSIRLSLHKGGCRPDTRGDAGHHLFTYSFFPHNGGFGADVVKEGYMLNFPPVQSMGTAKFESLASVSCDNVIIDTVKPCEDSEKAYILRLYESTGSHCGTVLSSCDATGMQLCNLLEEPQSDIENGDRLELTFRPFEIKTVKVFY